MEKNRRAVGAVYEKEAALFLERKGYQILEENFYTKFGEIDLIAKQGEYLVFVEVKYRKGQNYGKAVEAVTPIKQKRLWSAARVYLYQKVHQTEIPCRFDVIAFQGNEIVHIQNAFEM